MRVTRLISSGVLVLGVTFVLVELTSAIPHPLHHHHHHPHHHLGHHGHGWHKKLRLLEFYGDGRTAADLSYPAAYVELKYPVLRHPRHNTLPDVTHHWHHHHGPPPPGPPPPPGYHDDHHDGPHHHDDGPFPPSELEWRSGPPHPEHSDEVVVSGGGPGPGGHGIPNRIVTYTKTVTLEKGPGGVTTREKWDPPIVENIHPSGHGSGGGYSPGPPPPSSYSSSSSPNFHDDDDDHFETSSGGGRGPRPYDILSSHHNDGDDEGIPATRTSSGSSSSTSGGSGGYESGPSSSSGGYSEGGRVGGGGGYSSSGYGNHVTGSEDDSSSKSQFPHPNSISGGYSSSSSTALAAPLIENLGEVAKEGLSAKEQEKQREKGTEVKVHHQEKVIKNVALNEYIWVRREEGTPNIRLTLDPVRRSTYFLDDVVRARRIHVVSRERICIQGDGDGDGGKATGAGCTPEVDDPLIHWDFVPIHHGQYWIQQSGTNSCLQPGPVFTQPRFVEMRPCDLYEAQQLWELGTVIPSPSPPHDNYSKGGY